MKNLLWIPIFIGALVLSGCAGTAARAIALNEYVQVKAETAYRMRLDLREEIRNKCVQRFWRIYDNLVAEGREVEAAEHMVANYPPLLTQEVYEAYKNGDPSGLLSTPIGCEVAEGSKLPQASADVMEGP